MLIYLTPGGKVSYTGPSPRYWPDDLPWENPKSINEKRADKILSVLYRELENPSAVNEPTSDSSSDSSDAQSPRRPTNSQATRAHEQPTELQDDEYNGGSSSETSEQSPQHPTISQAVRVLDQPPQRSTNSHRPPVYSPSSEEERHPTQIEQGSPVREDGQSRYPLSIPWTARNETPSEGATEQTLALHPSQRDLEGCVSKKVELKVNAAIMFTM